ncbi:MAG: hypothetical protein K2H36_00665 [Clostridia bacterium]|nr:hypothetical protein [Clostridia bacterium]
MHIVRELTKIHEEHIVTTLEKGFEQEAKGEYVLIVECAQIKTDKPDGSIEDQLKKLLDGGTDKKTAIKQVAKANSLSKDEVYKVAINMD